MSTPAPVADTIVEFVVAERLAKFVGVVEMPPVLLSPITKYAIELGGITSLLEFERLLAVTVTYHVVVSYPARESVTVMSPVSAVDTPPADASGMAQFSGAEIIKLPVGTIASLSGHGLKMFDAPMVTAAAANRQPVKVLDAPVVIAALLMKIP